MSPEQSRSAAHRFIEQGFNHKNLSEFEVYFSPNLVDHALPPVLPPTLEGRKLFASAFFAAFPDIRGHIEDLVVEGDKTVMRWSAQGTQTGELIGIPATGKQVSISGIASIASRMANPLNTGK